MQAIYFNNFQNSYVPHILKEIYLDKIYNPYLDGKKDLTIVDIGGNIGLTSFYFSDYAKQVYCVEPAKEHIECIDAMKTQNKMANIKICPFAISNETGKANFYKNDNVTMFSLKDTVNKKDDFEEVDTYTLEDFMKNESITSIDLLKLDVEGFENELITSEGFRNVADKIKVIVGEWHAWGVSSQDLFANTMRDLGFNFKWLQGVEAQIFIATKN